MDTAFIAEPIVSIDERLLGVELLTRFIASDGRPLHPEFVISSWDLDRKRLFYTNNVETLPLCKRGSNERIYFVH